MDEDNGNNKNEIVLVNPKSTDKERKYQDKPGGQFIAGNPGRPEGSKNKFSIAMLEKAIEDEEEYIKQYKGVSVFRQFVKMAYSENAVMIALMRKFIPDKEKIEHSGIEPIQITIKRANAEH